MGTELSKSVMFNLIKKDFSTVQQEELIEEIATPNSILAASQNKYLNDYDVIAKEEDVEDGKDDLNYGSPFFFNEENDLVFKPGLLEENINGDKETSERKEIIYYIVQAGDTVSTISRRFGITVNTILWANNLSAYSLIRPGDKLTILPCSGVLYTVKKGDTLARIAQKYDIELEKIVDSNSLGETLAVGQQLILPGAKKIQTTTVSKKTTNYTGVSVIKDLISPSTTKTNSSSMVWPTVGNRITQYFSWAHNGLDIANKVGTPIYAANSGTVIIAQTGYNGGYGNTILIDHGNGVRTRYGHASKLLVKVGDKVEKGQTIMLMGSTGRSTGPHLHFEVVINGTRYNPLNYIKY